MLQFMSNTERLLDRARDLCIPPTDYALAKRLGVHQQVISRVRCKGGGVDNYTAFRLAQLLSMEPATVVAYIEEDRAPAHRREFWRHQLPRLLSAAALALTITAGTPSTRAQPVGCDGLYIMRIRRGTRGSQIRVADYPPGNPDPLSVCRCRTATSQRAARSGRASYRPWHARCTTLRAVPAGCLGVRSSG